MRNIKQGGCRPKWIFFSQQTGLNTSNGQRPSNSTDWLQLNNAAISVVQGGRVLRPGRKHQLICNTNIPRPASAASYQPDTK